MKTRKTLAFLAAMMMAFPMAFTGCGSEPTEQSSAAAEGSTESSTETASKEESGEPVELSFYISGAPVNEMDRIMEKVNATIKEEINATMDLIIVDGASYGDKMNLMISSGDPFDICFSAFWLNDFWGNANKGAWADLTDLIPEYAPESYSRIPESLWDGVKVDGRIMAIPNYQQWGVAQRKGFCVRSDIAEEVGFDWKKMKGMDSMTALKTIGDEFLSKACAAHPDMLGWEVTNSGAGFSGEPLLWDMEAVGDQQYPGWIRYEDPNTVINQFETEEFAEFCNVMRDWYNKGYVRKDGATVTDSSPDRKAGRMLAAVVYGWPDTLDAEAAGIKNDNISAMSMCTIEQAPSVAVSTTRTVIPATAASNACTTINAASPNIEKSLELIELLNTNDELYMLLTQGEEGVDYTWNEDETIKYIDGMYNFNYNEWQVGQSYSPNFTRALYPAGETGEIAKKSQQIVFDADKTADASPVSGFNFDTTPVQTQMAQCDAVIKELVPALESGSVDPAEKIPELLSRLEGAGVNDIIAEKQKQYDAWREANNQ